MKNLEFLGVGGACAVELGGNCAFLKDGETLFLIDCCEEATAKLKAKNEFIHVSQVVVAITHTHFDHIAGLGTLIWFCNAVLNIKPKIICNSPSFESHLRKFFDIVGLAEETFEFIDASKIVVDNCKVALMPTSHTNKLDCFGVMFVDEEGKYYYSGDTNDFETIKTFVHDDQFKKVYCETSWESHGAHIKFDDLQKIKSDKLVLMHFEDAKLYDFAKQNGFNVAQVK